MTRADKSDLLAILIPLGAFCLIFALFGCQSAPQLAVAPAYPSITQDDMLPPEPVQRALAPFVVPPAKRYWLVFSNPNPATLNWVVESKLGGPWNTFALGSVGGFQEASNQFWPTQAMEFFRVGWK